MLFVSYRRDGTELQCLRRERVSIWKDDAGLSDTTPELRSSSFRRDTCTQTSKINGTGLVLRGSIMILRAFCTNMLSRR
jgi:hypothetical protein